MSRKSRQNRLRQARPNGEANEKKAIVVTDADVKAAKTVARAPEPPVEQDSSEAGHSRP